METSMSFPSGGVIPPGFGLPPHIPPIPGLSGVPARMPHYSIPPPAFSSYPATISGQPIIAAAPQLSIITNEVSQKEQQAESSESKSQEKKSVWSEHKAPDGRIYYYNSITKQSSWEKPDDLKTPGELLLSQCPWKEYKTDTGKVYYHNVNTKESRWSIPEELENLKKKIAEEEENLKLNPTGLITSDSGSKIGSALDQAVAATLAAIQLPEQPVAEQKDDENESDIISSPEAVEEIIPKMVKPVFKDKKAAIEAFKDLLRSKNVSSNATWEQALKAIQKDSRYQAFSRLNERKQAFNDYKTQKAREEKEEQRIRAKKAKADLEAFLMRSEKMSSTIKYYRCEEMFGHMELWRTVPDNERRDIYEDVLFNLAKKEKEESKQLRKRNLKVLSDLLDSMVSITYRTTWQDAQQMLLENQSFTEDKDLLNMDKEDALMVFEEHIRQLEKEEEDDDEREKRMLRRQQRKNREHFIHLLDELHEQGKLTSMSLWVELYPVLAADVRFSAMLGQPGSTPLDLFKFYVEDLKARFYDEKKIIKEILREKGFVVNIETTFEEFATVVCEDQQSATLDAGNVKLTYNSLLEKAEAHERERLKEEARKQKKIELAFRTLLTSNNVDHESNWDEVRSKIDEEPSFLNLTLESERIRLFKEYQQQIEEACLHRHFRVKKNKKKNKKRHTSSNSDASSEEEVMRNSKRKKKYVRSSSSSSETSSSSSSDERNRKKKHLKKKRDKSHTSSEDEDMD